MKLQFKITISIVILLVIVISALSGVSFYFESQLIRNNMMQLAQSKLDEVENTIFSRRAELTVLKSELNKEYLNKAKILDYVIQQNPRIIENSAALFDMAALLEVDEIHITDENGILKWGTIASFFGLDFNADDQTRPFMEALTNKDFELVQDASLRSIDNVLFQYIGVARKDKPGIIQIGVSPQKLKNQLEKMDVSSISKDSTFGNAGFVIIVNKENDTIVSHRNSSMQGKKAAEFDWGKKIREKEAGEFTYLLDSTEFFMSYRTTGENIICATIPVKEFTEGLNDLLRIIAVISIGAIILCIVIIYFVLKSNVVNEIKKLLKALNSIGEGNLTELVDIKSSKEFKSLSQGINVMMGNLRTIIEKVFEIANRLKVSGDRLAISADQSSRGAEEIATTITELADGANDLAEGATRGAITAKDVLDKAKAISGSIEDTVRSANLTKESVEEGVAAIRYQNEKMEQSVASSTNLGNSINDLARRATEIDEIVNVITEIAEQTNMLALNAAIEAARAGEIGKGFAVVADEVRKLAEGSTKAAQQISNIISEIQKSVDSAKAQAEDSIKVIHEQQASVKYTEQAFEKINKATHNAVDQVGKIAEATDNIIIGIMKIVEIVEAQAAASEESAAGTEEISASMQEQTAAIEEVSHIANSLNDVVDELETLINRFKI